MRSGFEAYPAYAVIAAAVLASSPSFGALTDNIWQGLDTATLSTATDMTNGANWSLGHAPTASETAVFIYSQSGLGVNTNVGDLTIPAGFAAGAIRFQILNSGDGVSKLILNNNMSLDNITLVSNGVSSGGDMNDRLVLASANNVTLNLTGTDPLDASLSAFRMINPGWVGDGFVSYQTAADGHTKPSGFSTTFNLTNSSITFAQPSQSAFAANDTAAFTAVAGLYGTSNDDLSNSDNSVLNFTSSSADGKSGGTINLATTGVRVSGTLGVGAAQMNVRYDQTWIGDPTSLIRIQHRTVNTTAGVTARPFMIGSLNVNVDPITGAHTTDGTLGTQRLDNLGQLHIYVDFKNDDFGSSDANGMRIAGGTYGSIQINNLDSGGDPMAMILDADVNIVSNGVQTGTYTGDAGNVAATTTPYGLTFFVSGASNDQNVLSLNGKALSVTQGVWFNGNGTLRAGTNVSSNGETMRINASGSTVTIGGDLVYHSLNQSGNAINNGGGIDGSGSGWFASRRIGIYGDAGTILNLGGNFIVDTASQASVGSAGLSLSTVNLIGGAGVKTFEVADASTKTGVTTGPAVGAFEQPITGGFSIGTLNIGDGTTAGNVQLVNNYLNDNAIVTDDGTATSAGEQLIAGNLNINANSTLDLNGLPARVDPLTVNPTGTLYLDGGTVTGNVTLNGGLVKGYGTITGDVTAGSGPHTIAPSAGLSPTSTGTLTVGTLTTNANTTLSVNLVTPGTSSVNDVISVTGANGLTLNGGAVQVANNSTGLASLGYYKLIQYTGTLNGSIVGITMPAIVNHVAYVLDTVHDPGFVDVHRGLLGDANDDGLVNFSDFVLLSNNFTATNKGWSGADFNGDGITNFADFVILSNNFGATIGGNEVASSGAAPASGVPEPASLALLGLGSLLALRRRRR